MKTTIVTGAIVALLTVAPLSGAVAAPLSAAVDTPAVAPIASFGQIRQQTRATTRGQNSRVRITNGNRICHRIYSPKYGVVTHCTGR